MKFDYRFTYRIKYVVWRGRKSRPAHLTGVQPVEIVEVDPADAPIAYRITTSPHNQPHEVRAFGGSLWWPVLNRDLSPLEVPAFLRLADADWWEASRVLDPLRRTYYLDGSSSEEFCGRTRLSEDARKFDDSDRKIQATQAEWDASNVIFCGDRVLFNGGDPIWYGMRDDKARCVDLEIGHSDLDRLYFDHSLGFGFMTPGPDRKQRIASAAASFAFGLGEKDFALGLIADLGYEVTCYSDYTALSDHIAGHSAALCVRASALNLREFARSDPELRRAVPELEDTSRANARSSLRADQNLLRHFVSRSYRGHYLNKKDRIASAHKALDRLALLEPLAEEDDAAIAMLGIQDGLHDERTSNDPTA
jgi:hypothetical protein